jgi:hypothetical protein
MKCPNCGASGNDGRRSCQYCGVELELRSNQLVVSGVHCPECGAASPPDLPKCQKCGTGLFRICANCKNRIYLLAERCGHCGKETGFQSSKTTGEQVEQARKLASEGKYSEAERLLSGIREQALDAPALLLIAEVKLGRLRSMASDVRFADSVEQVRSEAKAALGKAVQLDPGSPAATRASQLLHLYSEKKKTHDYKPLVIIVLVVSAVLLVALCRGNG